MDKKLGKRVRQLIDRKISQEPLSMTQDKEAEVPQGCSVYRRDYGTHTVFLALIIDPKDDRFTIECAWSADGKFPAYAIAARPRAFESHGIEADRAIDDRFRFRLCSLWEPLDDAWWQVVDESSDTPFADAGDTLQSLGLGRPTAFIGSAEDAVEDATSKIMCYAIPYFESELDLRIRTD